MANLESLEVTEREDWKEKEAMSERLAHKHPLDARVSRESPDHLVNKAVLEKVVVLDQTDVQE